MSKYKLFDKSKLKLESILERISKSDASIMIDPEYGPPKIDKEKYKIIERLAENILESRRRNSPIIIAYGAHLYKNGCSPILIKLMEKGYVQQLLTNGAGIIHDFEMTYIGKTEENVAEYLKRGQFGLWEETGRYLNECINQGAKLNKGLGESVGEMILRRFLNKKNSIVARAYELNIPLSCCVGIGQDINHMHPACDGGSIGKTSYTDFLIFANTVSKLNRGIMLSIGSAVMAPMVFEKSLSMAKNIAKQQGKRINNYKIFVNDIHPSDWDWKKGEPSKNNPAYYLRFCKSFSRMGGDFEYIELDNRKFIHNLYYILKKKDF